MESRIERLCIESGVKMTGQRRVVARVLSDATDHPNVEELYRRASAIDPRISIATVYRTVRLLEEKGIAFDVAYREVEALELKIAFITDPTGVYIEFTEGLDAY